VDSKRGIETGNAQKRVAYRGGRIRGGRVGRHDTRIAYRIAKAEKHAPSPLECFQAIDQRTERAEHECGERIARSGNKDLAMNLDKAFYGDLVAYAKGIGVPAEWFLRIFYLESGLDPSSDNGSFVGLNQMSKGYLTNRRIDPSDYKTWPASKQLTDVVGPWYESTIDQYLGKVPRSVGVLYALNLAPGIVKEKGDNASVALYSAPDSRYYANKGLDLNGNGSITIGDLDAFLAKKALEAPYQSARKTLATYDGSTSKPMSKWLWAPIAAITIGMFAAVTHFIRGNKG
jgi:hypothetical protein